MLDNTVIIVEVFPPSLLIIFFFFPFLNTSMNVSGIKINSLLYFTVEPFFLKSSGLVKCKNPPFFVIFF